MRYPYAITDPRGRFLSAHAPGFPDVALSFTDEWGYARKYATLEEARKHKAGLLEELYDFHSDSEIPRDYLRIVKAELREVE